MNVHAAELGAAVKGGEHLARVQRSFRIEGALQALLLLQIGVGEHLAHEVSLLHADPVFTGQHASHLDAKFQDLGPELLRLFQLARHVGVIEDQRMQIPVPGVEHVGDAKTEPGRHLGGTPQDLRECAPRDSPVHAVVVR